jgi:hypothetical protein
MINRYRNRRIAVLGTCAVLSLAATSQAAFLTYTETFDTDPPAGFTENTGNATNGGSNWEATGGTYVNRFPSSGTGTLTGEVNSGAAVAPTGFDGSLKQDFVVSARVRFNSVTVGSTNQQVELALLDSNSNPTEGSLYTFQIQYGNSNSTTERGRFRLVDRTGGTAVTSSNEFVVDAATLPPLNTWFTMTVTGDYNDVGTSLALTGTLSYTNASSQFISKSVTLTDSSSPATGNYFGFRDRVSGSGGAMNVSWDDLTVTVPEPASAMALAGGLLLLARRRRAVGDLPA